MNFLSNVLREDGGFEYKKAIVDSILILIKDIPDAKEPGLGHLCEFIEARSSLPILCSCLVEDSPRQGAVEDRWRGSGSVSMRRDLPDRRLAREWQRMDHCSPEPSGLPDS